MDAPRRTRRLRWWGAAAGVVMSVADAVTLGWMGTSFTWDGRDVFWLVAGWFSGTGALLGYLLGDVVERRRRERATAEALADARTRVAHSEKLATLGQLAAAIAHEVRNPLAVVRSAAQGLTEALPETDAAGRRAASFIIAEVDRLTSVVGSLLAFARPLQLHPASVAVDDIVGRAVALAAAQFSAKGVRLRREDRASSRTITADGDLVCQALLGLLSNAAEAVEAGGSVVLETRAANGAVELAVTDDGPGIPPDLRARIFEPFFTTRRRGTGLGLAVVRQIVEAHGGTIAVSERAGGGACFTMQLPAGAAA